MKKIALALLALLAGQLTAQINPFGVAGISVPQYMVSGTSNRIPVVFRMRVFGLQPNTQYQYVTRAITASDFGSTNLISGAGNAFYFNSNGSIKYLTSAGINSSNQSDTFTTDMFGDYEGWFGIAQTGNSRFNAGNYIYPHIVAVSLNKQDTLRAYCGDSISVLAFGSGSGDCSAIWGESQAAAKSVVALWDDPNGPMSGMRPLAMTMVESMGLSNFTSQASFYSSNVSGVKGNWGTIFPNNLGNGIKAVSNHAFKDNKVIHTNTDADGIWGPDKVNTVNASNGSTAVKLSNDAAALVPTKIEFWARTSNTAEGKTSHQIFVSRKYSNDTNQSVRISLVGGTATNGKDFSISLPQTLVFKAGAAVLDTLDISIDDDNIQEGAETIVFRLDQAQNCTIGTEVAHTVTIADNDTASISVQPLSIAKENAGTIGAWVKFDKPVSKASKLQLIVKYQGDSTLIPAEFKLGASERDSIFDLGSENGADSIMIFAKITDDIKADPNDTIILALRQLQGNCKLSKDSLSTLVMLDNDGPSYVQFVDNNITVKESDASFKVKIRVISKTDAGGDFTLRLLSNLSTAKEGSDFTFNPTSKILNISSSTPDTIEITVPIKDDTDYEPTEIIKFGLGKLSNVVIVSPDTFYVNMINDDVPMYTIGEINNQSGSAMTADSLGTHCRVRGTVHSANMRSGSMSFTIADATGGMGVYSPSFFGYSPQVGDSVLIQGKVGQFMGMVQMDNLDTVILIANNRNLMKSTQVTQVDESTESQLVWFRRVKLVDPSEWPTTALAANKYAYVRIMGTTGRIDTLNIDAETDLDGTAAPSGYLNITGIGMQFDGTNPYKSNYVLTPRGWSDIVTAPLPTVNFANGVTATITELADSFRMDFSINPADENFTFDVAVASATAVSPTDYNFATRTINVAKNNSVYTIRCNISDDDVYDGDKQVVFAIRNIQGPASIGADSLLTLTITDNEVNAVLSLSALGAQLFPNPAQDVANLRSSSPIASVEVLDMQGRLVQGIDARNSQDIQIDTRSLNGVYIVRMTTSSGLVASELLQVRR